MKHNSSYPGIYEYERNSLTQEDDSRQSQFQSSVPLRRRKEHQDKINQLSQSILQIEGNTTRFKKSSERNSRVQTKENSANFSNLQFDFNANSTGSMLPPPSGGNMSSQSRKVAKVKNKKEKASEREQNLQMQALQLQFMKETLFKLQEEKQNRTEIINKTLSRKGSFKGSLQSQIKIKSHRSCQKSASKDLKNDSELELKQLAKAGKHLKPAARSGSRRAAKAGVAPKVVQSPVKSRKASNSRSLSRTQPRICELHRQEMKSSAFDLPRQLGSHRGSQERLSQTKARSSQSPVPLSGNSKKQKSSHRLIMQQKALKHLESVKKADLNQTGLTAHLEQSSARPIKSRDANDSQMAVRSFFKSYQQKQDQQKKSKSSQKKIKFQMGQDQGCLVARQSQSSDDSVISGLTQDNEIEVCEAPLQITCLDNSAGQDMYDKSTSPKVIKKHNQKDGKDSIEAFRSVDNQSVKNHDLSCKGERMISTNKDERRSDERSASHPRVDRSGSQYEVHVLQTPQIISEHHLSSCEPQNQSRAQQEIGDFFEKEYKKSQKELLQSKAQLYEAQFKAELLKKKLSEYEKNRADMMEEMDDLREQLEQRETQNQQCSETHNESQAIYTRDLETVKNELLKIQDQSATELLQYEQAMKQMTLDAAGDLKQQRKFVKDLVAEVSGVEKILASTKLSPLDIETLDKKFEENQRGKLTLRFNSIYKTLKNLNDEIIQRKKQLGRTVEMKQLLNTGRTSQGRETADPSASMDEFEIQTARNQNTRDFLAQEHLQIASQNNIQGQNRSQSSLGLPREPSSVQILKTNYQNSQNSVSCNQFAAQTTQQLQLMTSMNNLVTEARTITNDSSRGGDAHGSRIGNEATTPTIGNHQSSKNIEMHQVIQDQNEQQQKDLANMVQKLQQDLGDIKQQSNQLLALNQTLADENRELRQISRMQTERSNNTQKSPLIRQGYESDRPSLSKELSTVDEENMVLQEEKKQLLQLVNSLKASKESQDVMIQYLQGTQNSILQKMQHQVLKNQFANSLIDSQALATSFLQKETIPLTSNATNSSEKQFNTTSQGEKNGSESLDIKYLMAQRQQDISQSIRAFDQERGKPESLEGKFNSANSIASTLQNLIHEPEINSRQELKIIDENAEKPFFENRSSLSSHLDPVRDANAIDNNQDYESKTLSEHNRQHIGHQRGVSPVTQVRKVDSRKSLSYQKQLSSHKANRNDISVVSLSQLNSNTKLVPEQMRQILRLQSSQDGTERDRYLETGAFEKRSGLFSLDGTAAQEGLIPTDDFSGHHLIEKGEMSPVKNMDHNEFQSNQLLHLVECMQDASAQSRDGQQTKQHTQQNSHRTQSIDEKDMQKRIIFSAELTQEEEGPISSPEMDMLTQSESGFNTQNQSMKTKEQREIEQIIAQAKFSQRQINNDYGSVQVDKLVTQARQMSQLAKAVQNVELKSQKQDQALSPSFNQDDSSLNLPFLSKEETVSKTNTNILSVEQKKPKCHERGLSQEIEHLLPCQAVDKSLELPMKNSQKYEPQRFKTELTTYDEKSATTHSATYRHNIRRSSQPAFSRAINNSAMTSHETTLIDNLLQRENTQGCGQGDRLVTASLQHMPTEQYMPTQKIGSKQLAANQSIMYSPFKTHHQGQFTQQGSFPFSHSRSTSPNQNEASGLAASSERIQKRTKKMQQEIDSIDKEIAMLQNDISR